MVTSDYCLLCIIESFIQPFRSKTMIHLRMCDALRCAIFNSVEQFSMTVICNVKNVSYLMSCLFVRYRAIRTNKECFQNLLISALILASNSGVARCDFILLDLLSIKFLSNNDTHYDCKTLGLIYMPTEVYFEDLMIIISEHLPYTHSS